MRTQPLKFALLSLFGAAALLSTQPAQAAKPDFDGLAHAIQATKHATGFPAGTAVILVKDGKVAYQGYFGYADIEAKTPVGAETAFYIASATKPFFALDVLLAEHAGGLDTGTTLQAMFPAARFTGFDANAISARQLLTHTAGLDNMPLVWATAYTGLHDAGIRQRLLLETRPNSEAPAGTFDYTNVGYNIASVWLDEATGMPWQEQLASRIFKPLGMTRTTARASVADAGGWPVAKPYSFAAADRTQPLYLRKTDATMHAAGGMLSTAPDLATFLIAQLADGKLGRKQVLPADVVRASHVRQASTDSRYLDFPRDGYAWGWYTGEYQGRRMLHHFGGFAGFHAHLSFMPDENIGLVVLNNEDVLGARLTNLIAEYAYAVALGNAGIAAQAPARFTKLAEDALKLDQSATAQREKIRAREWRLSLPRQAYAGRYAHALLGDVTVGVDGGEHMQLRWGQLQARATGYDKPEHVRVEFVPGSGDVLEFVIANGKVEALVYDDLRFEKAD
jgi:CubicO group peptidase (beta-lactamase class C family)